MTSSTPLGAATQRERGQVLVLFAFVLVALLLISALAVDYGGWLLARRTYQNVADEAALAGAYQLTNPTGQSCDSGATLSKQQCARIAAWKSIDSHIGIFGPGGLLGAGGIPADATTLGLNAATSIGVTWQDWKVWVASPPSDAGADYPGNASSDKTVYVHVERTLQNNLSRMVRPTTKVGAWATAGRIPENFAIIVLCRTGCLAGGQDLQVAGTGSNLVLESGDLASNSWAKTSGSGADIALCEGGGSTSQCSAYMHTAQNCAVGSVQCSLVGWNGTTVDSNQYSAIALPQVIDPQYTMPSLSDTRSGGVVSGTVPYQCYGASDSVPAVSAVPSQQQFAKDTPLMLTAAQLPPTAAPVTLGAWPPAGTGIYGQVTDSATSAGINAITVTATDEASPFTVFTTTTARNNGVDGRYSFTGLVATHVYTVKAHDTSSPQAYGDLQYMGNTVTSGNMVSLDFSLTANPIVLSGQVTGISPASGITITLSGTSAGSTTTDASGNYSFTLAPGTYTVTPTVPNGYSSTPTSGTKTLTAGGSPQTQNFVFAVVPTGGITGTIKDETTGLPLYNATVTITSSGSGGPWTTTTDASGSYTVNGLPTSSPNPKYTVTASKTGWYDYNNHGHQNGVSVVTSPTVNVSLTLWPDNCGTGGRRGSWDCDMNSSGTGCTPVTDPTLGTVRCSTYDNTNLIRPGTYDDITIGNNECAWIDPLGGRQGLTGGQKAGIVYVTDTLSIGSNAFLFGDGVTIVLAPGAHVDVNNAGGFVTNYEDTTAADQVLYGNHAYRTQAYMGGQFEGGAAPSLCSGDTDSTFNFKRAAWTTGGDAHVGRYTWDTSGAPCYQDGDHEPYTTTNKGEIGIAWYLRGAATCCGGHRFQFSGQMGFLFDGVLYGPKDDIDLGGQGAQAAAGQIVAYTLKFHGTTNIYQRWGGLETTGPPYLIEPYIGE